MQIDLWNRCPANRHLRFSRKSPLARSSSRLQKRRPLAGASVDRRELPLIVCGRSQFDHVPRPPGPQKKKKALVP